MINLLQLDARSHPDLFHWNGSISAAAVQSWLSEHGLHLPPDLRVLWEQTGGGELFETETILSPSSSASPGDDIDEVNRFHWNRGLADAYFIFHIGSFGLSAIRLSDQTYVALSDDTYEELAEFSDLDHWYTSTIRSEFAERYRLQVRSAGD